MAKQEDIFKIYNKELISRLQKEFYKSSIKNGIEKWAKDTNRQKAEEDTQ